MKQNHVPVSSVCTPRKGGHTDRPFAGNRPRRTRTVLSGLLAVLLLSTVPMTTAVSADTVKATLPETEISAHEGLYPFLTEKTDTYTYDFSDSRLVTYTKDEKLSSFKMRTGMLFDGKTLSCKPGKEFAVGGSMVLGDDYGLKGGDLSFDLTQTGGTLSVGLRLSLTAALANPEKKGLWFTFDGSDRMTVTEPGSGLEATLSPVCPDAAHLVFRDTGNTVSVLCDDTMVCLITYDGYRGSMEIFDGEGHSLASVPSSSVLPAGYFTLYADDLKGTVDNLTFTHTTLTRTSKTGMAHEVDYSTWIAIDDLDRVTPMGEETGKIREEKRVGLFYFLCHGTQDTEIPYDHTYLYETLGYDGWLAHVKNPEQTGGYYWAEPYFGYYTNTDEWIYRKHAYMLEAAGVDFIFLDLTNGALYPEGIQRLFDTWLEIRQEGNMTPEICIFANNTTNGIMGALRGMIYSDENWDKYEPLFYRYQGKPLYLGAPASSPDLNRFIEEKFTRRACWAWQDKTNTWSWLQEYVSLNGKFKFVNGGMGRDGQDRFEELALCVGHHPTTSKGRSYQNGKFPELPADDFGFTMDSGAGIGFAEQFKAIMHYDPDTVLITGWNEWQAGLSHDNPKKFAGCRGQGFSFVDQFNPEYSRDAEPMRIRDGDGSIGFGDNYYYQMSSMIRTYKGWKTGTPASGQASIALNRLSDWDKVGPVFGDTIHDTAFRGVDGQFKGYRYINNTGRNDFLTAQVSQDADYLYFRVDTADDIIVDNGADWMNLFLDTDGDMTNGWEGYDFVLNRARDGHYVSVESLKNGWKGRHIGQALYTLDGNTLVIRLKKSTIGLDGHTDSLLFKWADHATLSGDIMEFMELGDTAPNDRYAYRYVCPADQGNDRTLSVAYTLSGSDGEQPLRNESERLPGTPEPEPEETKPMTEPPTEPPTEPDTELTTELVTDPTTEPPTEPPTERPTDPTTDPATEPVSEPVTEPAKEETKPSGCASAVGVSGIGMAMLAVAGCALSAGKKRKFTGR